MAIPEADTKYREVVLTAAEKSGDGWDITDAEGWHFTCPPAEIPPKAGDVARFYGAGIGYTVRGLTINGREVFYRTAEQEQERHRQWVADEEARRERELEAALSERDAAYNALPEVFQLRIDKFRNANPNFRRDHEPYEIFTCQQAILIAEALKDAEKVRAFAKADYDQQKAMVPSMSDDHSGNTFGMACRLAHWYLTDPVGVEAEHGALTALTGCHDYGCPHPYEPRTKPGAAVLA